jgi:hypothetical protein
MHDVQDTGTGDTALGVQFLENLEVEGGIKTGVLSREMEFGKEEGTIGREGFLDVSVVRFGMMVLVVWLLLIRANGTAVAAAAAARE